MDTLATPGQSQVDTGAGVFPALTPPAALLFPGNPAIADAKRWLVSRRGETAFAVVSASWTSPGFKRPAW